MQHFDIPEFFIHHDVDREIAHHLVLAL